MRHWMARSVHCNDFFNLGHPFLEDSLDPHFHRHGRTGAAPAGPLQTHPDDDGDGIENSIDTLPDIPSSEFADAADMVIMVDNWGTDNSLCDIGPMPWGDGIVDVQDLIILVEHLFEEFPAAQ